MSQYDTIYHLNTPDEHNKGKRQFANHLQFLDSYV